MLKGLSALSGLSAITGGGAAPAFSPSDISGLVLWLKADAGLYQERTGASATTPAASDADPVGSWLDQSGNARHYTAASDAERPTLRLAVVNSMASIEFDSVDDNLAGVDFSGLSLTAVEAFLVVAVDADPPADPALSGLWRFGASDNTHFPYTDGSVYESFGSTTRYSFNPTPSLAAWRLVGIRSESGSWVYEIDGATIHSSGTNTVGFYSGASAIGKGIGAFYLDGKIAEIIFYDSVLSAEDRANVETYIADRYGLTIA